MSTTSPEPIKIDTKALATEFINKYDTFLFDCDGVLWLGTHLLPHTKEFLEMLESMGKQTIYVTNNSTKSRREYVKKFASLGITAREDQIFGSAYSSALYVRDFLKLEPGRDKVWVFGEAGLREELELLGYEVLGADDTRLMTELDPETSPFLVNGIDDAVRAVVAGLDTHVSYHKLGVTMQYLERPDVHFVGANIDVTFPRKGHRFPGTGALVECIAASARRRPEVYCGKPEKRLFDVIASAKQFDRSKCCMVGDRLNTDIKFGVEGQTGGTLLVLSGIQTEEDALKITDEYPRPMYYAECLGSIYELYQQ